MKCKTGEKVPKRGNIFLWCGRRDSNPHDLGSRDFKSLASTCSATSARKSIYKELSSLCEVKNEDTNSFLAENCKKKLIYDTNILKCGENSVKNRFIACKGIFMKKLLRITLSLLFLLGMQSFAKGEVVSDSQKAELFDKIAAFNFSFKKDKNPEIFADNIPKKFLKAMAIETHATEANLLEIFKEQFKRQQQNAPETIYSLDADHVTFGTGLDGTLYALIPTHVQTKDRSLETTCLAIYEEGHWGFIYSGAQALQNPIFIKIYPGLLNVKIASDKLTPVTK